MAAVHWVGAAVPGIENLVHIQTYRADVLHLHDGLQQHKGYDLPPAYRSILTSHLANPASLYNTILFLHKVEIVAFTCGFQVVCNKMLEGGIHLQMHGVHRCRLKLREFMEGTCLLINMGLIVTLQSMSIPATNTISLVACEDGGKAGVEDIYRASGLMEVCMSLFSFGVSIFATGPYKNHSMGPNGTHHCIITEILGITLVEDVTEVYGDNNDHFLPNITKKVAGQVALGVVYLHKCGIVHGENLHIKVFDFREASIYTPQPQVEQPFKTRMPCAFAAPEIIFNDITSPAPSMDIWALEVLLYMILHKKHAISKSEYKWWSQWATHSEYLDDNGEDFSEDEVNAFDGLFHKMFHYESEDTRIDVEEVVQLIPPGWIGSWG
ncbi:kinase-like domain-containing protein [Cyathus striatus]|nr:kinase-like domain-containing protein [Cyathus striatus]